MGKSLIKKERRRERKYTWGGMRWGDADAIAREGWERESTARRVEEVEEE